MNNIDYKVNIDKNQDEGTHKYIIHKLYIHF